MHSRQLYIKLNTPKREYFNIIFSTRVYTFVSRFVSLMSGLHLLHFSFHPKNDNERKTFHLWRLKAGEWRVRLFKSENLGQSFDIVYTPTAQSINRA